MSTSLASNNFRATYTFSSQPEAIQLEKHNEFIAKSSSERMGHLMFDRRVIRGSTMPHKVKWKQPRIRKVKNIYAVPKRIDSSVLQSLGPDPFTTRLHQPVQTDLYLEELPDAIEESDATCQTDAFLNRPETPQFVPAKTGKDEETQICEGDLFDFELEVTPLLEVLIGKTIEQSLLEVFEEEELADLRAQQYAFDELRNAEKAEVQRLMYQNYRLNEEKERRKKQAVEAKAKEKELVDKVSANIFARAYLEKLVDGMYAELYNKGYFYDPVERDIEEGFIPLLLNGINEELDLERRARLLLDLFIRQIVDETEEEYRNLDEIEAKKCEVQTLKQESSEKLEEVGESKKPTEEDAPERADEPTETDDHGADSEEEQMQERTEPWE